MLKPLLGSLGAQKEQSNDWLDLRMIKKNQKNN